MSDYIHEQKQKMVDLSRKGEFNNLRRYLESIKNKTVLMLLAEEKEFSNKTKKCVEYLLFKNMDPCAADEEGNTAAHLAARTDNLAVLGLLPFESKWLQNKQGFTPLMEASAAGSWKCVKHLLHQLRQMKFNDCQQQGNLKRQKLLEMRDKNDRTALDIAKLREGGRQKLQPSMAKYIEREMQLVVDSTGLIIAPKGQLEKEQKDRAKLKELVQDKNWKRLLEVATLDNCDFPDAYGFTVVMQAAQNANCRDKEFWTKLLSLSDPTCATTSSVSCLHTAADSGNSAAVSALLDAGASVNVQDIYGMTPLMAAAKNPDCAVAREVCEILLDRDADWSVKNDWGRTALDLAEKASTDTEDETLVNKLAALKGKGFFDETDGIADEGPKMLEPSEKTCAEWVRERYCRSDFTVETGSSESSVRVHDLRKHDKRLALDCKFSASYCSCPKFFQVGESGAHGSSNPSKTILIIGAKDSGKAAFINGLVNAYYRVQYSDAFRLQLVPEPASRKLAADDEVTQSQRRCNPTLDVYTVFPVNTGGTDELCRSGMDCPITIIDVEEFEDNCELYKYMEIIESLAKVLDEGVLEIGKIPMIYTVCFVLRASQSQLTDSQKLMFKECLLLFDTSFEQLNLPVFTFGDSNEPKALAALKACELPSRRFLKLTDGILYSDKPDLSSVEPSLSQSAKELKNDEESERLRRVNWDQDGKNFQKLFKFLKTHPNRLVVPKTVNQSSTLRLGSDASSKRLKAEVMRIASYISSRKKELRRIKYIGPRKLFSGGKAAKDIIVYQYNGSEYIKEQRTVQDIARRYHVDAADGDAKTKIIRFLETDIEKAKEDLSYELVSLYLSYKLSPVSPRAEAARRPPQNVVECIDDLIKEQRAGRGPDLERRIAYLEEAKPAAQTIAEVMESHGVFEQRKECVMRRYRELANSQR